MLDYRHNSNSKKDTKRFKSNHFWDMLIRTLFISGVLIIAIMIALKWFGLIK